MRRMLVAIALVAAPIALPAQTPGSLTVAAESITSQAIAQHVSVIAHDSMRGRATPSRGLEMTAQYVADQFKQLGLLPGVEDGTWFQPYAVPSPIDFARSRVVFTTDSTTAAAKFSTAARLIKPTKRKEGCQAMLVAGRQRVASLALDSLRNSCVLYVPPAVPDAASQQVLEWLQQTSLGLVVFSAASDSADFARRLQGAQQRLYLDWREEWSVEVRPEAVPGLSEVLNAAGAALPRMRTDTTPVFRRLPALRMSLDLQFEQTGGGLASNVIGVLEGSDSARRDSYVIVMAHMDHAGASSGRRDHADDNVNDNASGLAGLIELARAFSRLETRPTRSLAFVATSGHGNAFAGSEALAKRMGNQAFAAAHQNEIGIFGCKNATFQPTRQGKIEMLCGEDTLGKQIRMSSAAVVVNLDRIGRGPKDSVFIDGLGDIQFPTPPAWVLTKHPELQLTITDGGTSIAPTSDHFAFTRRSVPSLHLHDRLAGEAGDSVGNPPKPLDVDRAARIARFAFYFSFAIADTKQSSTWTDQGRQHFLEHTAD